MPADYAKRGHASRAPSGYRAKSGRGNATRRTNNDRRTGFSWGSFVTGMVVGIGVTLTGALVPYWWPDERSGLVLTPVATAGQTDATPPTTTAEVVEPQFTFWDELPRERAARTETAADPRRSSQTRRVSAVSDTSSSEEAIEYLLQAGSFSRNEDAERLRGSLMLLGMPADTMTVTLPGGAIRHRVLVGPYSDERDFRRAQTQLREQNIDPLPLRRTPAG